MRSKFWWGVAAGFTAVGSALIFGRGRPTERTRRADAEAVLEKGHRCIENGEFSRALRLGERLLARRYTGGYELVARVFFERGKLKEAIEVLGKGVTQAPAVWVLWSQLGYCLSEVGQHDKALEAFGKARECDSSEASVDLNEALVYLRKGSWEKALEMSERVISHPDAEGLRSTAQMHRFSSLAMGGRAEEAILEIESSQLEEEELASMLAAVAFGHPDAQVSERLARRALARDPTNSRTLSILRDLRDEKSSQAVLYRVDDHDYVAFVAAETPSQAQDFVADLGHAAGEVDEIAPLRASPGQQLGVLEVLLKLEAEEVR